MENKKLKSMINGWFIGNFEPSILKSTEFEMAVKYYKEGDYETSHVHKIATEYTVIINGEVKMNDVNYVGGDIIIIKPGEYTDFKCLTDVTTVVVKTPSVKNDKYE